MKKERRKKSYNVKTMEEKRGLIKKETGTDPDAIFLKSIFICKFLSITFSLLYRWTPRYIKRRFGMIKIREMEWVERALWCFSGELKVSEIRLVYV